VSKPGLLAVAALSLIVAGCGTTSLPRAPWAKPNVPASTSANASTSARAVAHRLRAEELERQGSLREAYGAWNTALSLEPAHVPTQQAVRRVRARIDREVADHLQRGRLAAAEARRHYQAALALDPDSRAAQEALRTAPACPGCRDDSPVVAVVPPRPELGPATSVVSSRPPAAVSAPPPVSVPAPRPEPLRAPSEEPEVLYNSAIELLAEGRDDDAHRALTQLARVKVNYKDSATLLRNVRTKLVRQHYQEGLRLFREEKLEQAIGEWRIVLEIDPRDVNARRNIEQAERMLRTLAEEQKR